MPSSVSVSLSSAGAGVLAADWPKLAVLEELWLVGVDDDESLPVVVLDVPLAD